MSADPNTPPSFPFTTRSLPRVNRGAPLYLERPGSVTKHLSPFVTPARLERLQGVAAQRTRHVTALVEGVHDPHNLSACIRSCDAFGIQHLHVVPQAGLSLTWSPVVASGATRWVTVHMHPDVEAALETLRRDNYRIVATDLGGNAPPTALADVRVDQPLCVVFGNEHDGISDTLRASCDERMRIPMYGFVESFNISVAFALGVGWLRQKAIDVRGVVGDLGEVERLELLDSWLFEDVPRAPEVLAELQRRATNPPELRD